MNSNHVVLSIIYIIIVFILACNVNFFTLNLGHPAWAGVLIGPACITIALTVVYIKLFDIFK